MLVITRRTGEWLNIYVAGDTIRVKIIEVHRDRVSVGVEAPSDIKILRGELVERADTEGEQVQP